MTSPPTIVSRSSPTRTSSAPRSSMPAVTPLLGPDGVLHATRTPRLSGARSRQPSRIASNRPASRSRYRRETAASCLDAHRRPVDRPSECGFERRGAIAEIRRVGRGSDVDAVAEDDAGDASLGCKSLHADRLRQDPAELAPRDQQIVRPLDVDAKARDGLDRFRERQPGGERQQAGGPLRIGSRRGGLEHGRHVQPGARRREPLPAESPAARGLLVGNDDRAHGIAAPGQREGDIIGRANRVEEDDAIAEGREPSGLRRRTPRRARWATDRSIASDRSSSDRLDLEADVDCRR